MLLRNLNFSYLSEFAVVVFSLLLFDRFLPFRFRFLHGLFVGFEDDLPLLGLLFASFLEEGFEISCLPFFLILRQFCVIPRCTEQEACQTPTKIKPTGKLLTKTSSSYSSITTREKRISFSERNIYLIFKFKRS